MNTEVNWFSCELRVKQGARCSVLQVHITRSNMGKLSLPAAECFC